MGDKIKSSFRNIDTVNPLTHMKHIDNDIGIRRLTYYNGGAYIFFRSNLKTKIIPL